MVLAGPQVTSGSGYTLSQIFGEQKFLAVFFICEVLGNAAGNNLSWCSQL